MAKWRRIFIRLTVGSAVAGLMILLAVSFLREPAFAGKTFSQWFDQYTKPKANRDEAVNAMIGMGPRAVPYLMRELTQSEPGWRKTYRERWATLPGSLKRYLPTPKPGPTRPESAAILLGHLGADAQSATPQLLAFIHQKQAEWLHFQRTNLVTVPPLIRQWTTQMVAIPNPQFTLSTPRDQVLPLSLRALGRIGGSDPEFVKVMLEAARHPALYSACYGSAYETNFRPAIRAAFPLLQASLEKTNDLQSPVRTFAATAVGQLIPEVREAAPLLARTLDTNLSGLMRAACAMPISKADADYRLIVPALVRDLGRGGDFVVRRTLFELSARTPLVVDELTAALQRPEPAWQANIATALAEYGDKAAGSLPRLRALASTQDSTLGYAVGLALWRVGKEPDVWVPYLVEVLKSPDNQKKWTALQQLAEIGEPASRAVPQVTEMLSSDPNNRLRGQAAITLGEIGPKAGAGLPALSAAQADEYLNVREAASKAIPKVRGR